MPGCENVERASMVRSITVRFLHKPVHGYHVGFSTGNGEKLTKAKQLVWLCLAVAKFLFISRVEFYEVRSLHLYRVSGLLGLKQPLVDFDLGFLSCWPPLPVSTEQNQILPSQPKVVSNLTGHPVANKEKYFPGITWHSEGAEDEAQSVAVAEVAEKGGEAVAAPRQESL